MDGGNHCKQSEANIIGEKDGPRTLRSGRTAASYQTDGANILDISQDEAAIVFGYITRMMMRIWQSTNKTPEQNPQLRDRESQSGEDSLPQQDQQLPHQN